MNKLHVALTRNTDGRLSYTDGQGSVHVDVQPVRAFPLDAAMENIAIVSADGHELVWMERLADVPEPARTLIEEELRTREFMPEITGIDAVSSSATPCQWDVRTDRGATRFTLKSEQDIRRVSGSSLLLSDDQGVFYLIRDPAALDRASRRILDRFL